MALSRSPETTPVLECQYFLLLNLKHRICLNNNLKKCHDLGYSSFSLNEANQMYMSKLDKKNYLRMLQSLVIIYQLFQ
jgi:hypothetical protein